MLNRQEGQVTLTMPKKEHYLQGHGSGLLGLVSICL